MYEKILGDYLVDTKRITPKQLEEVMNEEKAQFIKLGTIAISEKLMTAAQTEEVNALQAVMDKRFGDIAVEKGYLTQSQVMHLLSLQGNAYLLLVQTLIDKGLMTMEKLEEAVVEYQTKYGLQSEDMEALKSGDIDRIVPVFLFMDNVVCRRLYAIGVRSTCRLIDHHLTIRNSYIATEMTVPAIGYQTLVGAHQIFAGIVGQPYAMSKIAKAFAEEEYISDDEDALDAVCEFINCVNGFLAIEYSQQSIDLDMEPPTYYYTEKNIKGAEIFVLPMTICGEEIEYIISVDNWIAIE